MTRLRDERSTATRLAERFAARHPDPAAAAAARGLAGFYSSTLHKDDPVAVKLRRARQREVAGAGLCEKESGEILEALVAAGLRPIALKGLHLARTLWPDAHMRPAGDLDLLFSSTSQLHRAVAVAIDLGFRRAPEEPGGLVRRPSTGVELLPPHPRRVALDLHERPFRSVGHRLDPRRLFARSIEVTLCGAQVLALDAADDLVYVATHAAKHAMSEAKWLVDLDLAACRADHSTWSAVVRRARAARLQRPVWAALRTIAEELDAPVPDYVLRELVPFKYICLPIKKMVNGRRAIAGSAPDLAERYALELLLEPGLLALGRQALGVLERKFTASITRRPS